MNYKQFSLEELYSLESGYILRHWANGGTSEFDMSINSISRAIIEKYNERHGNCFLGAINQHKFLACIIHTLFSTAKDAKETQGSQRIDVFICALCEILCVPCG